MFARIAQRVFIFWGGTMLNIFKKKQMNVITSPLIGKSIPLEDVSDKVFANKLMGDGIAF